MLGSAPAGVNTENMACDFAGMRRKDLAGRARTAARTGAAQPAFVLDSHIYFLFTQIFGRRNRALTEELRPLRISVPQWRILAVLHERRDCTMNQLADLTTVDRTTLTRALDHMVRDRLVERRSDPNDGRSVRLRLTPAGEIAFGRVLPRVIEQNARAVRGFSESELAALLALLHRMVRNLDPEYDRRNASYLTERAASPINNRRNQGDSR
jgi:DNA-binding MarR family transcriptional regulator